MNQKTALLFAVGCGLGWPNLAWPQQIAIQWDPVTMDICHQPEFIDHYTVYGNRNDGTTPGTCIGIAHEQGTVPGDTTRFDIPDSWFASDTCDAVSIWLWATATDLAGNESDRSQVIEVEPPDGPVPCCSSEMACDTNNSGNFDISDAISLFDFLFLGGEEPKCPDAGDADGNGEVDISDAIRMLQVLFMGEDGCDSGGGGGGVLNPEDRGGTPGDVCLTRVCRDYSYPNPNNPPEAPGPRISDDTTP
jgi:hypothetical protein